MADSEPVVVVADLGRGLELDTGTLSPLLRRLERRRLVRRERRAVDERRVAVHLTAAGAALRERAIAVPMLPASRTGSPSEKWPSSARPSTG
ncbi:winged helix DNA-binding protein [Nocardia wallacei]|uniref:winged helix DNA-binding protein n=1 Tax=Nocardia wallacei TaxID=480035 RepID=UPI0024575127|nr:winged helix DNA-binding protein [Nocardia wallacei]